MFRCVCSVCTVLRYIGFKCTENCVSAFFPSTSSFQCLCNFYTYFHHSFSSWFFLRSRHSGMTTVCTCMHSIEMVLESLCGFGVLLLFVFFFPAPSDVLFFLRNCVCVLVAARFITSSSSVVTYCTKPKMKNIKWLDLWRREVKFVTAWEFRIIFFFVTFFFIFVLFHFFASVLCALWAQSTAFVCICTRCMCISIFLE